MLQLLYYRVNQTKGTADDAHLNRVREKTSSVRCLETGNHAAVKSKSSIILQAINRGERLSRGATENTGSHRFKQTRQ